MKTLFKTLVFTAILFTSPAAMALDLSSAKSQGLLGEKADGYLGAVPGKATAEAKDLMNDINEKRREHYTTISKKNGQPISVVEKLAGEKVISRLSNGQYYQDASGKWVQK